MGAPFEKLEIWQNSLDFAVKIFNLTQRFSIEHKKSIGDQMNRSSLSISSNIAEGSGCESIKEETKYIKIAINSAYECLSQLYFCQKMQLLRNDELINEIVILIKRIRAFRKFKLEKK